ncbi:MAG: hypothetical protein M3131_09925 [Actinomycetota bacterium]|nr:hypothetical protein [Actinomycetota bacterium]
MQLSDDLTPEALETVVPGRALRSYPALVSTSAAAFDWATSGAPDGAVVVADYQLSPRGHGGRRWTVTQGRGLGFSLVMRPSLPAEREGWLYTVVAGALAEVCGAGATIEWPDEIRLEGAMTAAVAIRTRLGATGLEWAVVDVLLPHAERPRGELLQAVLGAIEQRRAGTAATLIEDYESRCETIGRRVRVRFIAGTGPKVEGRAVGTLDDGALLLELASGSRGPVRPQDVRGVEEA